MDGGVDVLLVETIFDTANAKVRGPENIVQLELNCMLN